MKTRHALIPAILGLTGCANGPPPVSQAKDLAAISAYNERYLKAINAGDVATLSALTVEDHIMMIPNRPILAGKANNDDANKRAAAQFDIRETWQPLDTVVSGDLAYQRGTFGTTVTPKSGGVSRTSDGKFLRIYRRQKDGSWTMVIDSFSSDRPP
jgi:ketosteroid isomerase-like protein